MAGKLSLIPKLAAGGKMAAPIKDMKAAKTGRKMK